MKINMKYARQEIKKKKKRKMEDGKKKCDSTHIILVHVELQFMRMKMLQGSVAFKKISRYCTFVG